MEIRVHGPGQEPEALAVTMRTPGQRLRARGRLLPHRGDARSPPTTSTPSRTASPARASRSTTSSPSSCVTRSTSVATSGAFVANASCGLCGKTTLDEVEQQCEPGGRGPDRRPVRCSPRCPTACAPRRRCSTPPAACTPPALFTRRRRPGGAARGRRAAQRGRQARRPRGARAGSCRSPTTCSWCRAGSASRSCRRRRWPASRSLCAVSAPSSLAVDAARRFGQTLVGLPARRARQRLHPSRAPRPRRAERSTTRGLEELRQDQVAQAHAARPVGRLQAVRHRRDEAQPLRGDGQDRLGEPRQPPVRVADPATRACATAARSASPASTTGRSTACTCARRASTCCAQHDGRARPRAARRRRGAARAAQHASCATSAGSRTRWCAARGEPGFTRVSWDEALDLIADRIRATTPDRLAVYLTARGITNEVYYVAQKVARFLGTNNVDNAARVCHAPSTTALKQTIGVAATTCSYTDVIDSDLIVLFGANVANAQPVFMKYLYLARKRGAKVAVVNPLREPGLERYWVPSNVESAMFGTQMTDEFFARAHRRRRRVPERRAQGAARRRRRSTATSCATTPTGFDDAASPSSSASRSTTSSGSRARPAPTWSASRGCTRDAPSRRCSSGRWASPSTSTAPTTSPRS